MARKLTSGQKAGLLFGGAILAGLLIVGKAEGKFDGIIDSILPPKRKVPPLGDVAPGKAERIEPGGYAGSGKPMDVPCDPLAHYDLAPHVGCYDVDGKNFFLRPEYPSRDIPKITFREIGVSADYASYEIGRFWVLGTLHPFLNEERLAGRFAVEDKDAGSIADFLYNDPVSFINQVLGADNTGVTLGDAVYTTAWMLAGGGVAGRVAGLIGKVLNVQSGAASAGLAGATLATVSGAIAFAAGDVAIVTLVGDANKGVENMYTDLHTEELAKSPGTAAWANQEEMSEFLNALVVSAVEAFNKLIAKKTCIWGFEQRKEMRLADLPYAGNPEIQKMFSQIFREILLFQRRDFSYEESPDIFGLDYD